MTTRLAYAVLAHHKPMQLKRLLQVIWRPQHWYVIHVDRGAAAEVHETARELARLPNVVLLSPPAACMWAGWSLVRAELRAMRQLLRLGEWSHYVVLSGQDFPLRTQEEIVAALERMPLQEWVEVQTGPDRTEEREFRERVFCIEVPSRKWMMRVSLRPFWRMPLLGEKRFIGSQWKVLTREACAWLTVPANTRRHRLAYRHTWIPDESFFQTVLLNSPFAGRVTGRNVTFVDWDTGPERPRIMRTGDLPRLIGSAALFARKFDADVDDDALRALEERLGVDDAARKRRSA